MSIPIDMGNPPAEVVEEVVTSFIANHYQSEPGAAPGINFNDFKRRCRAFQRLSYAAMKNWFKARPERYTVMGQLVIPHGVVVQLHSASPSTATGGAAATCTLPEAVIHPAVAPPIPAAVLTALTARPPGAPVNLHCPICHIRCTSEGNMRAHLRGARHAAAVAAASEQQLEAAVRRMEAGDSAASNCHFCELCGRWFTRHDQFQSHVNSAAHRARVFWLLLRQDPTLTGNDPTPTQRPPASHTPTVPRVTVSKLPQPLPPVAPGQIAIHPLLITNKGPEGVKLRSVRFLTPVSDGSMRLEDPLGAAGGLTQVVWLPEGTSYEVRLVLAPTEMGLMRNLVVFDFSPAIPVARAVAAVCCPPDMPPPLSPEEAQRREKERRQRRPRPQLAPINEDIVPGVPPPGFTDVDRPPLPVKTLPPPSDLRQAVAPFKWSSLRTQIPPLRDVTNLEQYAKRLSKLLWLEELQHEIDIRVYDMKGVPLVRAGRTQLLELTVPGLAENRPSVLKGDRIVVAPSNGAAGGREYEGYVHAVQKETVKLRFADKFLEGIWLAGRRFDVRFTVNRSAFNLMQNALRRAQDRCQLSPELVLMGTQGSKPPSPLAPGLPHCEPPRGDPQLWPLQSGTGTKMVAGSCRPLNWRDTKLNGEQRLAVREVLRGAHAPLPYVIFGPPGTGKTSTLVEAARQLLLTRPTARVLLVAPSNSAADQLAQRLSVGGQDGRQGGHVFDSRMAPGDSFLMRVCAFPRPLEDLPPDMRCMATEYGLAPYAAKGAGGERVCAVNWDANREAFLMPPLSQLMAPKLRAVVTTCAMAARLVHAGVPSGHFTHVLVDEAGHAEEPLQLCALAGLAAPGTTRVVLAGDHRQLGPIILSLFAKKHGKLHVSLLERLLGIKEGPYGRQDAVRQAAGAAAASLAAPYCSTYITKLLTNYRSHPAILKVPNAYFYDNDLRAGAPPEVVNSMLLWEGLPNKRVPMLMHHIVGKDEQEDNSPSWQNMLEARQVVEYVRRLMEWRYQGRPHADDIGIISPYKKQVQRIRVQLKELAGRIKVGSVEEFQGQERKIIIISTVRSSDEYLEFDSCHRLGFLANPKRFNVATTRAKALVIVVGNAQILVQDPNWRDLLRYLRSAGAIVGQALPTKVAERLDGHPDQDPDRAEEEEDRAEEEPLVVPEPGGVAKHGGRTLAAGGGGSEAEMSVMADMLQRLVLQRTGQEVRAPGPEEYAAMMTTGAQVQVEGGEMRRFD